MANSFTYKDKNICIGDTVELSYKIKEGNKERIQAFRGLVLKIKGNTPENKMMTVRKMTRSGIGVERIIPLTSPFLTAIKLIKKSNYQKAKLYFIRGLSDQDLRSKLYRVKTK